MNDPIPTEVRIALMVILNHVEPGWENCVALLTAWLEDPGGWESVLEDSQEADNPECTAPASRDMGPSSTDDHPFTPDWASSPGDTIKDLMEERKISVAGLAARLWMAHPDLLLSGELAVTPALAAKLEAMLGPPALFWLRREAQYREALARQFGGDHAD